MPSDDCEGGSLVIDGRRITPSRNEDRLVFIPLGVPHLVTPVTTGVRWVAKASVHAPATDDTKRLVKQLEMVMGQMGLPVHIWGGDDDEPRPIYID
jgi:hypothetical protein